MRLCPAVAAALLLLAGCSAPGKVATTSAPFPPPPGPVGIKEHVEMLQAGSRDYAWKVGPGARTLVVNVTLAASPDAPVASLQGYNYRLIGGPGRTAYFNRTGDLALGIAGTECRPCFDARDLTDDPGDLAGDWGLHLEWLPSAAHFDLNVAVTY